MLDDFDFSDFNIDFNEELETQDVESKVDNGVDLENLVYAISKYRKEVAFLKELKAKRNAPIDEKIKKITSNEEYLKGLILDLMPKFFGKKNSVDFPGVGKISKRSKKGKWVVDDLDKFVEQVESLKLDEDVIKVSKSVVAKFLPTVTAEMLKDMEEDDLEGVSFQEPEVPHSLAVTIYEPKDDDEEDDGIDF
jgi:hypothetical protein